MPQACENIDDELVGANIDKEPGAAANESCVSALTKEETEAVADNALWRATPWCAVADVNVADTDAVSAETEPQSC